MTLNRQTADVIDLGGQDLPALNAHLASLTAEQRIAWSLQHSPGQVALSSSFGIQAAVMLHMATQIEPSIPVILTDTGYLFAETYQFIDQLTERLNLNLKVYRSELVPAWQEARYGQLWLQGEDGLKRYNQMNKVEPMQRALRDLDTQVWLSGIRAGQSQSRAAKGVVEHSYIRGAEQPVLKVHPILEWNNRDIYQYLTKHELPYHPLWEQGYVSVGDVHTTRKLEPGMTEEETRFFGLTRECGLHENTDGGGI